MLKKSLIAALAAAILGTSGIAGAAPAAANGFSFEVTVGDRTGIQLTHGERRDRWEDRADRRRDRWERRHERRHGRWEDRHGHGCRDIVKVRRHYDRYGRLKIVKIIERDCRRGRY